MVYKVRMKKEDYFKINNKIISTNLEIIGDDVTFEIEGGSYNILKRTNYEFKLIESLKTKLLRFVSHYGLLITGVLFLLSILYMNIYRVSTIEFNRYTPINDEIEYRIKSSFRTLFCFDFCNLDYDQFSKEMQVKYFEYPHISVTRRNNTISVYIANVDEINYEVAENQVGDIIAKKDGIVDTFYVYSGKSMVSKNKYVKAGDVLIEGNMRVGGLVMGTTYDKLVLEIPKKTQVVEMSQERDDYYGLNIFNWTLNFGKDGNFELFDKKENTLFNLFDFISFKKIEEIKKNAIIKEYSHDEAYKLAIKKIEDDFDDHLVNELEHIVGITMTKDEETEDSYVFTFIIKKYESMGTLQVKE